MQSTSEGCMNIAELANQLRREKIFINSERQLLQNLNEEVEKSTLELLQAAWICTQQRQNLTNLITSRCEADSVAACQRASLLEGTTFVDAHKVFRFKEANALGELLGWLRDSPHLMALCLLLGQEYMPASLPCSLVSGLYGSCRSSADRVSLLAVVRELIKHQMAPSSDPRKLFRTGKCALSQLYSVFRDGHTPARQFLVATLQAPVMALLHEDEFFLDIDPDKAMERFSPADRLKKFGQANSAEYATKVARYRKWTVQALCNLASKFIASLRDHWSHFPAAVAWVVQQVVHLLKQHSRVTDRELHAICTDIVLNHFVCPAIVNPEAHGVVEVPVSYIARFNLIQVAQIVQMLALTKYQEVEPKVRDIYSKFERSSVYSLLETVMTGTSHIADAAPVDHAALRVQNCSPSAVALFSREHLSLLITFLKRISSKLNNNTPSVTSEEASSSSGAVAEAAAYSEAGSDGSSSGSEGCASGLAALLHSIEPSYRSRLHELLRRVPDPAHCTRTYPTFENKDGPAENGPTMKSILAKVGKPRLPRTGSWNSALTNADEKPVNGDAAHDESALETPEVVVITLANATNHDYVGLVPESKVLECYYGGSEAGDADEAGSALAVAGPGAPVQKRTRFSVSHDEVSLGNTSDNLEAVSEAASNHSVTSSLELETEDQNDNLSDMVSANVSGRGSPNISGRETPSSQVTDGDAANEGPPRRLPLNVPVSQAASAQAAKLLKQTRNEIEDKFCKFEIRKLLEGDETISIMSDTWSTDVLASDSETMGDSCDQTQIAANTSANANNTNAPDVSETASESAWSVDVLASDSDRNTEVDTDDCVSVAARSDTSWPRRPSHHEESTPVRHPNQSSKRPDLNSPKHASRPNLPNRASSSYLSATAQLSRGAELDLVSQAPRSPAHYPAVEHRKSILVNGYPVMTCYATSAPESPSTPAPPPMPSDVFDYVQPASSSAQTESTLDGGNNSDATSQWVDDSFPQASMAAENKPYSEHSDSYTDNDRPFDSGVDTDRPESESRSTITDLMTRMSSATISTSANLVNNITSRIVKSEIRTSIVSISSSRIDRRREPGPSNANISLSTLSINSMDSRGASGSAGEAGGGQDVTSHAAETTHKLSTGAIPKSISFDSSAEKGQRRRASGEDGLAGNLDELKNNVKRSGGNLLHKIKMFRQKGRAHTHSNELKPAEEEQRSDDGSTRPENNESSEDILAKYRRKSSDGSRGRRASRRASDVPEPEPELDRCEGVVDLNDPEVFNSMKRKLRMVLSNPDLHCVEYVPTRCTSTSLVEWVRASAMCASSEASASHASELSRALASAGELGASHTTRLAAALRADLAARRPYAAYLASCRAHLTHTLHALNRQITLVRTECLACARAAAAARVLEQLERGNSLRRLARHHHPHNHHAVMNGGELMDEKASRLTASIKAITAEVKADQSWDGATPALLDVVEVTVERAAFARLYLQVLFPNGDGDIARDQVLSEHIRRLAACTSAARAGVAARHLWAAPYPRAQAQLRHLAVCRTPRDKLACVMRCVTCLMAVLGLHEGSAPAADDLTPVLVYVVLRVNPPSLLSTIELVNALGGSAMQGEALYWWTHFCAAVAYIKTMDYPRHDS